MMKKESLFSRLRQVLKGLVALTLLSGTSGVALAAEYTAQEKANMQLVRDFYDALEAGQAKHNLKEAIVDIANKYIAENYIQHAAGGKAGRAAFIQMFQERENAPAGGPPPGAPPAGAPTGAAPPTMQPPKLVALMAEGDRVVQITSRGPMMIWNMFRVENGKLAEHWDAGVMPPAAGGPPK